MQWAANLLSPQGRTCILTLHLFGLAVAVVKSTGFVPVPGEWLITIDPISGCSRDLTTTASSALTSMSTNRRDQMLSTFNNFQGQMTSSLRSGQHQTSQSSAQPNNPDIGVALERGYGALQRGLTVRLSKLAELNSILICVLRTCNSAAALPTPRASSNHRALSLVHQARQTQPPKPSTTPPQPLLLLRCHRAQLTD